MENGVNALLIAFAVLIFVIAITITFVTISEARQAAQVVMYYSDRENFQRLISTNENNSYQGRTVEIDTVIATLTRCIREEFNVRIIDDETNQYVFDYVLQGKAQMTSAIKEFINSHATSTDKYRETFVEVVIDGKIYEGEDGTSLEEDIDKKIYITYKKIVNEESGEDG